MTPSEAKATQERLDASIAFKLPEPEVTEYFGNEGEFQWLLATKLLSCNNHAMSLRTRKESATSRGPARALAEHARLGKASDAP